MEPLALHARHASLSARFGSLNEREVVLSYPPAREYEAARSTAAVFDGSARQLLRLTGPDRSSFLHGMVTNEINKLAENAATDVTLITVKGAMVADARVVKLADSLLLDVEPGLLGKVRDFLDKFLISEEVELTDVSAEWGQLRLLGPRAAEVVGSALGGGGEPLAQNAMRALPFLNGTVWAIGQQRLSGAGIDLLIPRESLEAVFDALLARGVTPLGFEALEVIRVEAGVPRYGQDLVDTTIPLEADLTHAISYNKGCYIGQEVIARATFRGHMNRKLTGLLLGSAELAPGAELRVGEKKVGWITSVQHSPALHQRIALGYVHRDHLTAGTQLAVAGADATATVQPLPFVPPLPTPNS